MCLQGSEVRVNFVVMRPAETQEEGGSGREGQHNRASRRPEPQFFRRRSTYTKVLLALAFSCFVLELYLLFFCYFTNFPFVLLV